MNKALLEALAEAQQAQELAHRTHLALYKKMVEVNPLAAELFRSHLGDSQNLLSLLGTLEKIGKE